MGYLHWSLIDNYEWQEGYREEGKFGLLYIDHENSDFKRSLTNGAKIYSFIIKESLKSNEIINSSAIIEARKFLEYLQKRNLAYVLQYFVSIYKRERIFTYKKYLTSTLIHLFIFALP